MRARVVGTYVPVVLLFGLLTPLAAQPALVYTANSKNGKVLRLDFSAATSAVVNTNTTVNPEGLVLRNDGGLIVCDSKTNSILFYAGAQGAGQSIAPIALPDGPSLDAAGNLYVVGTGNGKVAASVWRIPRNCPSCTGGYGTKVAIDTAPPSTGLEDTRVVPSTGGALTAGDLLVLSREPAKVLRYPGGSPGSPSVFIPTSSFPSRAQPTGMTFTPAGELLVSTLSGTVVRFNSSGTRITPDFATGLGNGRFKIAAGTQDGFDRVFVASRAGGTVFRFKVAPAGTAIADGKVTAGVQYPTGVAMTSGINVTPAGTNVTVNPAPEVQITFDNVTAPGFTTAEMVEFADDRDHENCETKNLRDFSTIDSGVLARLPNVAVPCYVRGFQKMVDEELSGPETFLLAIIDTTVQFTETAEFHGIEEDRFGYQPACPNTALDYEPHTFYSPEQPKGEPPLYESFEWSDCPFTPLSESFGGGYCPVLADISSECGSNVARGYNFSLYLTARDTRTLTDIITEKLWMTHDSMWNRLNPMGLLGGNALYALDTEIHEAIDTWATDPMGAAHELAHFVADAKAGTPADINNSTQNVTGELISRAMSAKFFVCKTATDPAACMAVIAH